MWARPRATVGALALVVAGIVASGCGAVAPSTTTSSPDGAVDGAPQPTEGSPTEPPVLERNEVPEPEGREAVGVAVVEPRAEVLSAEVSLPAPPTEVVEGVLAAPWSATVDTSLNGDGTWTLRATGVPDHEIDALVAVRNGDAPGRGEVIENPTAAQDFVVTLPLEPELADVITPTTRGAVGLMVSGAALYGPAIRNGEPVVERNFEVAGAFYLDACNGHASGRGTYHYHGVPYCITDAVDADGAHSTMIGVALDGFPVHGPQDADGRAATDLDECGGHTGPTPEFPDGTYHYHLQETAPYGVSCLRGVVQPLDRTAPPPQRPTEDPEPERPKPESERRSRDGRGDRERGSDERERRDR